MGAYNILNSEVKCSNCQNTYQGKIQFKFGKRFQIQYKIGDKIEWGAYDKGKPGLTKVKIYGILENDLCPICNKLNLNNEFDMVVEKDIIIGLHAMENIDIYNATEDGDFVICD